MSRSIWATLGVRAGSDRDTIRRAYAAKLRETNPEDDPEGFMALRAAYEAALQRAGRVPEPVADEPALHVERDEPDAATLHVEPNDTETLHVEHEPEPADPELADLQARWDALASSLEYRWGADPALLRALIAAPAMERITVRAEIEGHVAALIADHVPKSDTLVVPAIRAFGWDSLAASRSSYAVRTVLERAAELPQNEGEAVEAPRRGFFNRLSQWRGGGYRVWIFAAILLVNVIRLATGSGPETSREADPAPLFSDESPSVPLGSRTPVDVPLKSVAPDAGRWLTASDAVDYRGSDAPTVKVFIDLDVTAEGRVTGCSTPESDVPTRLSEATCDLLVKRARLAPVLDGKGEPVARNLSMSAMWARQPGGRYAPVQVTPPPEPEPTRRAPECPREPTPKPGVEHPPSPCSPQSKWLRFEDFPEAKLLAAGSRTLTARYEIGRDGYISNCRLDPASGVKAVDSRVCGLLTGRAHYLPGRTADGRAARWEIGFGWGWTVTKRDVPVPVPEVPKAEFKTSATDAALDADANK